uniref:Uncharacterized protein n=1 Tax=Myoviridae sp. ctj3P51 TaxID=2826687 RepID=A0A8S5NQW3_9CAUD|nr:MAG TPA: hypothetical protein [Myoviridae sp. ctj3P51]
MPMTSPFEWYDKHFGEIEIANPVSRTRMKGEVIATSDSKMLVRLKQTRQRIVVIAVELDPDSIGLRTVRSLTVKVCPPEPCS